MSRTWIGKATGGAATLAVVALALAGCAGGGGQASEPTRIAFLNGSSFSPYNTAELEAARTVVEAAGFTLEEQSADYDPARQLTQCDSVVASGDYAGIIIVPAVGAAATPCVTQAAEAGLPIVSLETQIGPELYGASGVQVEGLTGQVYHDTRAMVPLWVAMAADACGTASPCGVGIVVGDPQYPDQAVGVEVFKQEAASYPQIEIAGEVVGGFSNPDGGISATQNLLQLDPSLKVIAVFDDETATGVVAELARQGRTDVQVIGFGGPAVAIDRIKDGTQFGSIVFLAKTTAEKAAQMVLTAIEGGPVEPNSVESTTLSPIGTVAVTGANVAEFTPEY